MGKKVMGIILVIVLIIGLGGCGKKVGAKSDEDNKLNYPTKPITIYVPWSVGGVADIFARSIAKLGKQYFGETVTVVNRTGAGGIVGMSEFMNMEPDGHSLFVTNAPLFSITPQVQKVGYTFEDFEPVIGMNDIEFLILVNERKSGISSIEDLVNYGKENEIKYGIGGAGGDQHIVMAAFLEMAKTKAKPVVFQGTLDSINSLLGGHVDVAVGIPSVVKDQVESGELKVIGTFSPEEYTEFEGIEPIPTVKSAGYDMEYVGFNFMAVPKDTPAEVVAFLNDALQKMYQDPEIQKIATNLDLSLNPMSSEGVGEFVEKQKESTKVFLKLMNNAAK